MWVLVVVAGLTLLKSVFAVLFASVALAWLFDPLIDSLERRGRRRETSILFLFLGGSLGSLAMFLVLGQAVAGEFHQLAERLVNYTDVLRGNLVHLEGWLNDQLGVKNAFNVEAGFQALREQLVGTMEQGAESAEPGIEEAVKSAVPTLGRLAGQGLKGLFAGGLGIALTLLNLLLIPVFTFYLLRDWDRAVAGVDTLVPSRQRALVRRLAAEIDSRLQAFVRGQLTVCLALGILYSLGLLLVGVDLAVMVGMLSGLLFIVPYLGTAVGIAAAGTLSVLAYGLDWHLLAVFGVFGVVQMVEGMVLTPTIVGDKVGLHPLVVMIALLVGGNLFGIAGMLLAIPATAAAQVLLLEWVRAYRASEAFGDA